MNIKNFNKTAFALIIVLLLSSCQNKTDQEVKINLTVSPELWEANESGTLELKFKVANGKLKPGDSLTIVFTGSWILHAIHSDGDKPNQSYKQLTKELYDFFNILPAGTEKWDLKILPIGFDGTEHRLQRTVCLKLVEGKLHEGSTFSLAYGSDQDPIKASFLAEEIAFPLNIFRNGSLIFNNPKASTVTTVSGKYKELIATIPSQAQINDTLLLHVTARDSYGNAAYLPRELNFSSTDSNFQFPTMETDLSKQKFVEIPARFGSEGFQFVSVTDENGIAIRTNPIKVSKDKPEFLLLWGDIHSHSEESRDGIGSGMYEFARDYANLDFFAQTEHSSSDAGENGISEFEWDETKRKVKAYYEPGKFVPLLAYEASFEYPYGHHNVFFATDEAPIYRKHEMIDLEELISKLKKHEAFTIPHHTGITWGGDSMGASIDWNHPEWSSGESPIRPLIEIYSAHGQSELYDPNFSLSYDNFLLSQRWKDWFTLNSNTIPKELNHTHGAVSINGAHYARDAWKEGIEFGVIASSDDHTARPGQFHKGLAAALVKSFDRKGVFEALRKKHTYGTTGQRIYMDFKINGQIQGSVLEKVTNLDVFIEINGTDTIEWVELVELEVEHHKYSVKKTWYPKNAYFKTSYKVLQKGHPKMYFVRMKQKRQIKDRDVMAWSSPIWVNN